MFAGAFMMGAKDRLLPPSVPFRFFAAAILYHVAGWAVLLWAAADIPGHQGGLGPVVAGLHLITLGVLAMTAMGAAYQMLPVATRRQLGPAWACVLSWWLFVPGVAVLSLGLAGGQEWALQGGAALTMAGLLIFAILVGRNLLQVSDLPAVSWALWIALAALLGLMALALALVLDVSLGFLSDRPAVIATHAVIAGYGFMGMLVFGFSSVLVPMFVLSKAVPDAEGKRLAAVSSAALLIAGLGCWNGGGWGAAAGVVLGLAAVALYGLAQRRVLAGRMRKRLEPFFRLLKAGWVMLPLSLLAALALALGGPIDPLAPLWGLLMVFGWLLSFATGILQRIMPFLASMHSGANGGKPVLLSRLTAQPVLTVHAVAHGAAVLLLAVAIVFDLPLLARLGALSGLLGALSFLAFAILMVGRYRAHDRSS
ncbi:hypothetical protein KEC16_09470 [Magnetospirillum sp. J10]|uniref:Uncharacterized protein n=2 Tax=Magnetospirillum sulfuroxidans TaxID=611300 RepID=A0ABS5IE14_9PROT|nr:hypothetical protein [Magnetospirillum sulfuroxidans]